MKTVISSLVAGSLLALTSLVQNAAALDNGVDPYNLRKGDWIYYLSNATNKLGGNVSSVTNVTSLMNYYKNQGISFVVVKAGTGSTNFPSASNPQFTSSLVTAAHNAGLKIFAYTRSYGTDVPGEIKLATNMLNLNADGFVIDAEAEWEGLANKETKATNLCQGIKQVYPNRFLGHSPFMYISSHSSFPYKQFGLFCDAVMPQAYWVEFGISATACAEDLDTQWNNWHNSLSGGWTNAIKPIAPVGQGWNGVTGSEITTFYNAIKNTATPATKIGYQGVSWWRADLHTSGMWTGIGGNSIGINPATAPAISAVLASGISSSGVTITWTTSQSSDSVVNYGLTTTYGSTKTVSDSVVYHSVTLTGLSASTTYHYRVKSKNLNNVTGTSGDFTFTTLPPGQVNDIILDNTAATVISGTWSTATASTDKYGADYRYKSQGTGTAYVQYQPNILTAGSYSVYEWHPQGANRTTAAPVLVSYNGGSTTVNVNQQINGGTWNLLGTYNFAAGSAGYVRIKDNFPDASQIVMADAIKFHYGPPASVPTAPSGLTAAAISTTRIDLAWNDNSSDESNFIVARAAVSGGPYTDIATLAANTSSYSDTTVGAGTTYYYVVRARNGNGDSANSNQASASTASGVPAAPSGLTATPVTSSSVRLNWTDNSANELNFIVARSTTSGGLYSDIAVLGANTTTYTDTGLTAGTTYYYVVRASNDNGSSANSNQAGTAPVADIVIDNPAATFTGTWSTGSSSTDKYGVDYRFIGPGTGANYAQFTPTIPASGYYQVYEWHPQGSNRTTAAPIVVNYSGGSSTVYLNQQSNGGTWVLVGTYYFAAGSAGNVRITDNYSTGSVVMADAIKFVLSN